MMRFKPAAKTPEEQATSFVFAMQESKRLLGGVMKGKNVVFVVDDCELHPESVILRLSVFEGAMLGGKSRVVTNSDFFSCSAIEGDALIVRSSRLFEPRFGELEIALRAFRAKNPHAAVILCAYAPEVCDRALTLAEAGVVNAIENDPPNDYELLRSAALILERLAAKR